MPADRRLHRLPTRFAIARLPPDAAWPKWASSGEFSSLTRTLNELSVVCEAAAVPDGVEAERGWRALEVQGPLDFSEVGILASLALPLKDAGISIFSVSTYDTDYVLVRDGDLETAVAVLEGAGWAVDRA